MWIPTVVRNLYVTYWGANKVEIELVVVDA